jgi:hypothetical protein
VVARFLKEKLPFKIEIVACMLIGIEIDVKKLSACMWGEVRLESIVEIGNVSKR